MANDVQNINRARMLVDELIPLTEQAESQFRSARNWGFLDVVGGGFIVDLIKHSKLDRAGDTMQQINWKLNDLKNCLGGIQMSVDYTMNVGSFATLADFMFDGILADAWMTGKIMSSLNQVTELKNKLYRLREQLYNVR